MSSWQPIENAPADGTAVKAGKISWILNDRIAYVGSPVTSRFIGGKWCADFGSDDWKPYEPQPDVWYPLE